MLQGFNSDITVKGQSYHIQTEDWGQNNPYLVTRIFKQGAVIKTFKTHYSEVLLTQNFEPNVLSLALKNQHYRILDQITNHMLG